MHIKSIQSLLLNFALRAIRFFKMRIHKFVKKMPTNELRELIDCAIQKPNHLLAKEYIDFLLRVHLDFNKDFDNF